jgi:hypothetical protein
LRLQEVSAPHGDAGGDDGSAGGCRPGRDNMMDEDCDDYPDDMDPCPAEADTMPAANADGDGAGDQCDPSAAPGDSIRLFDGFGDPSLQSWVAMTGMWSPQNGSLVNEDFDGIIARPVAASRMLAEVYVGAKDVGMDATFSLVLIDPVDNHFACNALVGSLDAAVQAATDTANSSSSPIAGVGQMRIQLFDQDQSSLLRCRITFVTTGKTIDATVGIPQGTPIQSATIQLKTSALHASVDSVTVAGQP